MLSFRRPSRKHSFAPLVEQLHSTVSMLAKAMGDYISCRGSTLQQETSSVTRMVKKIKKLDVVLSWPHYMI